LERLSPCHRIIRSVLYKKLGVDYGDVIRIDGAPITLTAIPKSWSFLTWRPSFGTTTRSMITQQEPRQLAEASTDLDGDAVVYPRSENVQMLCANCWRDPDLDLEHHERMEKMSSLDASLRPHMLIPSNS
jgi:hypothetical protein